jgi:hypothetical protein
MRTRVGGAPLLAATLLLATGMRPGSARAAEAWPLSAAIYQHAKFLDWAHARVNQVQGRDESVDLIPDDKLTPEQAYVKFNVPSPVPLDGEVAVARPPDEAIRAIRQTTLRYFKLFGRDTAASFLWTGVETGNPLVRQMDYRWNSLREAGMYDPEARKAFVAGLQRIGIRNMRFGISNHEIRRNADGSWDDASWQAAEDMISDLSSAGIRMSLDLHHFGIESRFCVDSEGHPATYAGPTGDLLCDRAKYDPRRSFYLHPDWPDYFADFALEAFRRFHRKVPAFTIMNEPETVTGFNAEMWHGGFPGWSGPDEPTAKFWATQRALRIGIAAVKARLRIEAYLLSLPQSERTRPVFLHCEAAVPKLYWPDFNQLIRYLTSDTILGQPWLLDTDFDELLAMPLDGVGARFYWPGTPPEKRTVLHYMVNGSLWWGFPADEPQAAREARRKVIFTLMKELQTLHRQLRTTLGQTMRSYTVLGIDYYAHNEDKYLDPASGQEIRLDPKPELYMIQLRAGQRAGLERTLMDYFRRYPMPVMVTETGTPYHFHGARWHQQMMFETARAAMAGVPILGHTMYPAIDTWGWEHALSRPKEPINRPEGSLYNPSGLFDLVPLLAHEARPKPFLPELIKHLW